MSGTWRSAAVVWCSCLGLSQSTLASQNPPDPGRPNILIIQADDLGYGDLSAYGQARFETPVLDRLAREGIRFTRYYAGSTVCAPSRAALMTGRHTGHAWIRGNGDIPLRDEDVTIAMLLREAGYRTAVIGKWGLGGPGTSGQPDRKGFEYSFGFLDHRHAHRQFTDHLWRNGERIPADPEREYVNDLFTREAAAFIDRADPRPFFIYLNYTVPHAELRVPEESLAPLRGRFPEQAFLNEAADARASGPDEVSLGYRSQPTPRAAYAAMITRMDRDIGRLADVIRARGLDAGTLLMFTSDNGPHREGGADPVFFNGSGGLRGIKRDLYEGGIRVPMIARWPGTIPAGRISAHVWAHWDVLPTLAALAGARVPRGLDGMSMTRALRGEPQPTHEFLYWEFHERGFQQSVRMGRWKAVRSTKDGALELYDLDADPGEQRDVAAVEPRVVTRIERYLRSARTESRRWPVTSLQDSEARTARELPVDWPAYGGGPESIRYSPLDQINRQNVRQLEVAWTYDSGEEGGLQSNPIVVDGVLYATTPKSGVVALEAATGALRWRFDSPTDSIGPSRGVSYWAGGNDRRIFAAQDHFLYALDARTGRPVAGFGRAGRIDLREDLERPAEAQSIRLTTPGIVYKDLIIVGGRVGEGLPASPGHIRAYDVRTGKLRWIFHTIPHPGEAGHETWPKEAWTYSGGANNWAGMAMDEARGIVFAPTGSAAADFYGANRLGDNLFADSLLALDAATGRRLWHFQFVRHDLWDRDLPSPPSLVTVVHDGRRIDAVAQTTKHGYVFLFERATGAPVFPIEYRSFPPSAVDGEIAADRQPIPLAPPPFARQRLTEDLLTDRTPEARQSVLEAFRALRSEGQFVPLAVDRDTVVFPGFDGGAEWGGSAFDPESGLLYVNANEMAWTGRLAPRASGTGGRSLYLRDCASCHRDDRRGAPPQMPALVGIAWRRSQAELNRIIRQGTGRMPAFPTLSPDEVSALVEYMTTGADTGDRHPAPSPLGLEYRFTGYKKFLDPEGYPAIAPPWGTLTALDLGSGRHAWQVPLGEYPELVARGVANTGSENYGGPIVTAGGLVFIGATSYDKKFRAFDKSTGERLWEAVLPFSATGTPGTYAVAGRQFVVVPAGGGKDGGPSGGIYVAFVLPKPEASRRRSP